MASLSKQALQVENVSSFPNNTTNYITPAILRSFNSDIIDSTVNQGEYTANSGSWNQQIDALEQFTASQQPSFTALNAFTASQLTINSGVNLFTQSANSSISQLNTYTASFTTSVGIYDENTFVNNVNQINFSGNGITASYVSGKAVVSVDFTSLNSFTASQATINNGYNSYTASQDIKNATLAQVTASLNAATQSLQSQLTTIGGQSGSWITESETSSFARYDVSNPWSANQTFTNITATSASFQYLTTIYETASVIFSSGSNQLGDELTDIQTLSGSVKIQGGLTINGLDITGSLNSLNASSASQQVSINALNTNSASVNISITNVNSATASLFTSVNNLNSTTASLNTSASLGLTTASFDNGTRNLTFTKGDASTFSVNIPDVSGSTGNFATTGSNTFTGNQTINADLTVSGSANLGFVNIIDNGGINLYGTGSTRQSYGIVTNPSNGDLVFNTNPGNGRLMTFNETNGIMNLWNGMKLDTSFIGIDVYDHPLYLSSSYGGMTTMLSAQGNVVVSGSLITTGSAVVTGTMIVAGVPNINYTSGSGIGEVYLLADSGSLIIGNSQSTPTYAALAHLSSSAVNTNTNLIFKPNTLTGDTIISGSSNIFTNPGNPTAGFKRYIGGSQNYFGATLPQITGSAAFSPTFTSNMLFAGMQMRIPTSASAYNVVGNLTLNPTTNAIVLGTAAGTNFEKAVSGVNITNNIIGGGILNATAYKTALSGGISIGSNNIGGTVTLNMDSSSINLSNSNIQGTLTVNNSYFPGTVTANSSIFALQSLLNVGTGTIYASGSNVTFTGPPRGINASTMLGGFNVMSASLNGDNSSLNSVHLLGQGLTAVGSNTRALAASAADWGSTFVGRWNSLDGVKDQTAENVFVVGTGTAEGSRKTGFLIDSGSNAFIEGTLNVSGSLTIQSGSTFFANGNKQFNVGAFQSNVNQSGSANVSQSMNFETTDISQGVSIASNSRITLANSGTYNIQFSAQILADAGADDVYIWLKKNGTNVTASAGHVVLANNEELIAAWNYVVDAAASDYFEIVWQSTNGDAILLTETATGNIPSIPSIILTVTQVR